MLVSSMGLIKQGFDNNFFNVTFQSNMRKCFKEATEYPICRCAGNKIYKLFGKKNVLKNKTYAKNEQTICKLLCAKVYPGTKTH